MSRILDFMSYSEYLQTAAWEETRQAALQRSGGHCALCPREGVPLEVHHRTYERLGEELPEDLTVLCSICHEVYSLGRVLFWAQDVQDETLSAVGNVKGAPK